MKNQKIPPPAATLVAWIGHADLKAAEGEIGAGVGPIAQAIAFKDFARIVLLSGHLENRTWWEYLEFSVPVLIEGESGTGEGFVGAGDSEAVEKLLLQNQALVVQETACGRFRRVIAGKLSNTINKLVLDSFLERLPPP